MANGDAAEARVERILDLLRSRGGRVTSARRAIIGALLDASPEHVTADELATAVQRAQPDVHVSTIYRCLDALEELSVVDHVHLGHGRAVYHLTDEHHQHLVCSSCGVVVEVPDTVFDDVTARLAAEFGFRLEPGHFAVPGRCRACSATGDTATATATAEIG
jgi:Fe2+ or Zn2+ uptake regulation protein